MQRLSFLLGALLVAVMCSTAGAQQASSANETRCIGFAHGIASGDPRPDSIILWTRYTPQANVNTEVSVDWYMSTSPNITAQTAELQGTATTSQAADYISKVDVRNLEPDTRYYYFFQSGNYSSLLGTTRTAPPVNANATIRFAQMSCASWRWGFFNVYNMTSRVKDLDFIVFLGDWIYEYSDSEYPAAGQGVQGRAPLIPSNELATLDDYRARHRLFRTDGSLVEMMRRVPVIAIWDDHDVTADNAYENGTANPVDGVPYATRKCNGVQAYHEYMPIRPPNASEAGARASTAGQNAAGQNDSSTDANLGNATCGGLVDIYRTFQFGRTMTLVMLEERLLAREEQYNYTNDPYIQALEAHAPEEWDTLPDLQAKRQGYYAALEARNRSLAGSVQLKRLASDFASSRQTGVTWQVLGNTVVMGPLNTPDVQSAVEDQGFVTEAVLDGILSTATSDFLEVVPAKFGGTARVLVGTGKYHDPVILDGWSGYQYERSKILDILAHNTTNPVVLSGDIHNAIVWRLYPDNTTTPVAIEFTTASVTAPGVDLLAAKLPGDTPQLMQVAEKGLHISNSQSMHYSNIRQRGAVFHTVALHLWHADYSFVDTTQELNSQFDCQAAFELRPGAANQVVNASCTPRAQLFYELYGPQDPLQTSAIGSPSLSQAAAPGTQLSNCSAVPDDAQDSSADSTGAGATASSGDGYGSGVSIYSQSSDAAKAKSFVGWMVLCLLSLLML